MIEKSTIQLEKNIVLRLQNAKNHPKETYNDIVNRILTMYETQPQNQYDEFLHKIQQLKMQEVWDNEEDEFWETV